MKICLDTNVIIDILGSTSDLLDSYASFDVCLLRMIEVYIPVTSTTDIAYLLPRRKLASNEQTREHLTHLLDIAHILDARSVDVRDALSSAMPDFEDALLAYMARRNGIDLILTRNIRDFVHSPVSAMSPRQFVEIHKPESVEYASVDLPS